MRKLLAVTVMALAVGSARAQEELPAFEVVSIRQNRSNELGHRMQLRPGGRIAITNAPLRALIETAYGLLPQQLTGGPDWVRSDRFDIVALASQNLPPSPPPAAGGPPGPAQLMLQRLLADRFKLVVHAEKQQLQIYALTLARDDRRPGPGISPAKVDCARLTAAYAAGAAAMPPQSDCRITGAPGRVTARGASMAMFVHSILAGIVEGIVEDRTGLRGGFDFDLEFAPDPGSAAAAGANGASIFTALEEQLGLKLRAVRAPVDVLVIDRVERPTED